MWIKNYKTWQKIVIGKNRIEIEKKNVWIKFRLYTVLMVKKKLYVKKNNRK